MKKGKYNSKVPFPTIIFLSLSSGFHFGENEGERLGLDYALFDRIYNENGIQFAERNEREKS